MRTPRKIAVITADTLSGLGLQGLLAAYFQPVETDVMTCTDDCRDMRYDCYFVSEEIFAASREWFSGVSATVAVMCGKPESDNAGILDTSAPQHELIHAVRRFLGCGDGRQPVVEHHKELSAREVQVLKLIVSGAINKEIADRLSISFNTVLTHRKNITAKLGIKTVSGLTFYAMTNGYVSSDDTSAE